MGQYWILIDLDTMTCHGAFGRLGLYFDNNGSFEKLIDKILQPPLPPSPTVALKKIKETAAVKKTPGSVQPSETTGLGHLPAELVAEIFSHIEDYADALCLGFTSSFVWDAGSFHIGALYVNILAPLEGHRIMCIGDFAEDLPPSLSNGASFHELEAQLLAHDMIPAPFSEYSESEQDDYQETSNDISGLAEGSSLDTASEAVKHDELQAATTTDLRTYIKQAAQALHSGGMSGFASFRADGRFNSLFTATSGLDFSDWYSPFSNYAEGPAPETELQSGGPNTWLLRNLSKKIYVRDDHLNALDTVTGGNDGENLTQKPKYVIGLTPWRTAFGLALFSNFCWSSDGGVSMASDGKLHRGAWAGDAFDIVQLKHLLEKSDADQWKDNTEDIKRRMVNLWKAENGHEPSSWDYTALNERWHR